MFWSLHGASRRSVKADRLPAEIMTIRQGRASCDCHCRGLCRFLFQIQFSSSLCPPSFSFLAAVSNLLLFVYIPCFSNYSPSVFCVSKRFALLFLFLISSYFGSFSVCLLASLPSKSFYNTAHVLLTFQNNAEENLGLACFPSLIAGIPP